MTENPPEPGNDLEKEEYQRYRAERAEAIGRLAGGIAHDFNNLLMTVQGNVFMLLQGTPPDHPHFKRLQTIAKSVERGERLTSQILNFGKGGKYRVEICNIDAVIQETVRMFSSTRQEIRIITQYEEQLWLVKADIGQVEQVLLNLFVNAADAMPEGGDLTLTTQNVILDERFRRPFKVLPGKYLKVSVSDTGHGMDASIRKKIFDPFFTTKPVGQGTGLGLSSAYGIVKNHGGIIDVFSEPGWGTTFEIYLPCTEDTDCPQIDIQDKGPEPEVADTVMDREAPLPLPGTMGRIRRWFRNLLSDKSGEKDQIAIPVFIEKTPVAEAGPKRVRTILMVDDDESVLSIGIELIRHIGFEAIGVDGGKAAVALFEKEKEKIDLVILDIIMPNMGGGETFDRLLAIDPNVKVLLASGYSANDHAKTILARGAMGFLQKPFTLEAFKKKLDECLAQ
jgi:two-component system, cell cycle sensor histidine kinase and response regulator CckA